MEIFACISVWIGFVVVMCKAADWVEKRLNKQAKKDISNWLQNLDIEGQLSSWPKQYVAIFDRVFGKNHLSWRCFLVSSAISITSGFMIITVFFAWIEEEKIVDVISEIYSGGNYYLCFTIFTLILVNVNADYFSLLETRYLLSILSKSAGISTSFVLFIDIIITGFIFVMIFAGSVVLVQGGTILLVKFDPKVSTIFVTVAFQCLVLPMLFTTYITSIWLWLYAFIGFGIKLVVGTKIWNRMKNSKIGFSRIFDLNKYPLSAMTIMGCLTMTPIALVFIMVFSGGQVLPVSDTPTP